MSDAPIQRLAMFTGVAFLAVGFAGFVPALFPGGLLFGVFAVNSPHNVVHIATGILALGLALAGPAPARMFFGLAGIIYALLAVVGFVGERDGLALGMAINMADDIAHVVIAAAGLWLGFFSHTRLLPPGPRHDLRGTS